MANSPQTTKSKLKELLRGHDESGAGDTLLREMLGLGEYDKAAYLERRALMLPEERFFLPHGVQARLEANAEYHKYVRGRPFHSIEPMVLSPAPSGAAKQVVGFLVEKRRGEDIEITQRDMDQNSRMRAAAKDRIRAVTAVASGNGEGRTLEASLGRHRGSKSGRGAARAAERGGDPGPEQQAAASATLTEEQLDAIHRMLDVPSARISRSRPLPGAPLHASANDLSAPLSNFTVPTYPLGLLDTQGGGGAVSVHRRNRRLARLAEAREARREGRTVTQRGLDRAMEPFARPRTKEVATRWRAREAKKLARNKAGNRGRGANGGVGGDGTRAGKDGDRDRDQDQDGISVHVRELLLAEDVFRDSGAPVSAVSERYQAAWSYMDLMRRGLSAGDGSTLDPVQEQDDEAVEVEEEAGNGLDRNARGAGDAGATRTPQARANARVPHLSIATGAMGSSVSGMGGSVGRRRRASMAAIAALDMQQDGGDRGDEGEGERGGGVADGSTEANQAKGRATKSQTKPSRGRAGRKRSEGGQAAPPGSQASTRAKDSQPTKADPGPRARWRLKALAGAAEKGGIVGRKSLQAFSLRHASYGAAGRPTSRHAAAILSGGIVDDADNNGGDSGIGAQDDGRLASGRSRGSYAMDSGRRRGGGGSGGGVGQGERDGLVPVGGADEITDPRGAGYMSDASRGSSSEEEERIIARTRRQEQQRSKVRSRIEERGWSKSGAATMASRGAKEDGSVRAAGQSGSLGAVGGAQLGKRPAYLLGLDVGLPSSSSDEDEEELRAAGSMRRSTTKDSYQDRPGGSSKPRQIVDYSVLREPDWKLAPGAGSAALRKATEEVRSHSVPLQSIFGWDVRPHPGRRRMYRSITTAQLQLLSRIEADRLLGAAAASAHEDGGGGGDAGGGGSGGGGGSVQRRAMDLRKVPIQALAGKQIARGGGLPAAFFARHGRFDTKKLREVLRLARGARAAEEEEIRRAVKRAAKKLRHETREFFSNQELARAPDLTTGLIPGMDPKLESEEEKREEALWTAVLGLITGNDPEDAAEQLHIGIEGLAGPGGESSAADRSGALPIVSSLPTSRTAIGSDDGRTVTTVSDPTGPRAAADKLTREHDAQVARQRNLEMLKSDSLFGRMRLALTSDAAHVHQAEQNRYVRLQRIQSGATPMSQEDVLKVSAGVATLEELQQEKESSGQRRVKMLEESVRQAKNESRRIRRQREREMHGSSEKSLMRMREAAAKRQGKTWRATASSEQMQSNRQGTSAKSSGKGPYSPSKEERRLKAAKHFRARVMAVIVTEILRKGVHSSGSAAEEILSDGDDEGADLDQEVDGDASQPGDAGTALGAAPRGRRKSGSISGLAAAVGAKTYARKAALLEAISASGRDPTGNGDQGANAPSKQQEEPRSDERRSSIVVAATAAVAAFRRGAASPEQAARNAVQAIRHRQNVEHLPVIRIEVEPGAKSASQNMSRSARGGKGSVDKKQAEQAELDADDALLASSGAGSAPRFYRQHVATSSGAVSELDATIREFEQQLRECGHISGGIGAGSSGSLGMRNASAAAVEAARAAALAAGESAEAAAVLAEGLTSQPSAEPIYSQEGYTDVVMVRGHLCRISLSRRAISASVRLKRISPAEAALGLAPQLATHTESFQFSPWLRNSVMPKIPLQTLARAAATLLGHVESQCQEAVDRCVRKRERLYATASMYETKEQEAKARKERMKRKLRASQSQLTLHATGSFRRAGASSSMAAGIASATTRRGSVGSVASLGSELLEMKAADKDYHRAEARTTSSLWYTAVHGESNPTRPTKRSNVTGANLTGLSRETLRLPPMELARAREENEARVWCTKKLSQQNVESLWRLALEEVGVLVEEGGDLDEYGSDAEASRDGSMLFPGDSDDAASEAGIPTSLSVPTGRRAITPYRRSRAATAGGKSAAGIPNIRARRNSRGSIGIAVTGGATHRSYLAASHTARSALGGPRHTARFSRAAPRVASGRSQQDRAGSSRDTGTGAFRAGEGRSSGQKRPSTSSISGFNRPNDGASAATIEAEGSGRPSTSLESLRTALDADLRAAAAAKSRARSRQMSSRGGHSAGSEGSDITVRRLGTAAVDQERGLGDNRGGEDNEEDASGDIKLAAMQERLRACPLPSEAALQLALDEGDAPRKASRESPRSASRELSVVSKTGSWEQLLVRVPMVTRLRVAWHCLQVPFEKRASFHKRATMAAVGRGEVPSSTTGLDIGAVERAAGQLLRLADARFVVNRLRQVLKIATDAQDGLSRELRAIDAKDQEVEQYEQAAADSKGGAGLPGAALSTRSKPKSSLLANAGRAQIAANEERKPDPRLRPSKDRSINALIQHPAVVGVDGTLLGAMARHRVPGVAAPPAFAKASRAWKTLFESAGYLGTVQAPGGGSGGFVVVGSRGGGESGGGHDTGQSGKRSAKGPAGTSATEAGGSSAVVGIRRGPRAAVTMRGGRRLSGSRPQAGDAFASELLSASLQADHDGNAYPGEASARGVSRQQSRGEERTAGGDVALLSLTTSAERWGQLAGWARIALEHAEDLLLQAEEDAGELL